MIYVDLLESLQHAGERYVSVTRDLKTRIADHDAGKSPHTSKFRPCLAFSDEAKALAFERWLKQGSGHAFANRHLC